MGFELTAKCNKLQLLQPFGTFCCIWQGWILGEVLHFIFYALLLSLYFSRPKHISATVSFVPYKSCNHEQVQVDWPETVT